MGIAPMAVAFVLLGAVSSAERNETADIDLGRYLGTWYEIAHFPTPFQRGCTGTTATYSRTRGRDIAVENRCYRDSLEGPLKVARGKAWVPDEKEPGKLKVQFFWPFFADYWVLEVGDDYRYAVVGHPDRKYCWILSRTPTLDERTYQGIVERLRARGYEVSRLERTLQPQAPPPRQG